MGININVPNTIQQNTPLRTVRSGATGGDEDNNVKYVPQSLTDAQKAQARQNIGAGTPQVQADWNQTNTSAPDYIKNKPNITPGGATINEFHYKRGGSEGEYYYYIDCPGYTPAEGDLMIVIFDWIMDPTAGCTLRNGTDVINIDLRNAPSSEYNYYDDIYGTPNTRWTVKLEKDQSNNWHAYNISTIELPDWNVTDEHAVGYIKNKPSLPVDEIPEDFRNSITVWSNVDTTLTSKGELISVYNRGVKTTLAAGTKTCDIKSGKNVVVGSFSETQFANKGGIYWVWTPRSFANSHTIFNGAHKHLNVIYYGGGYWNNGFGSTDADANSKIFALNCAAAGLWQGFNTNNNVDIVFPDDTINLGGMGTGGNPSGNGKWYVPQARYEEFIAKCATKWSSADPSTYLSKIVVYDHLEQRGFELNIVPIEKKNYFYVENTTNADETVTISKRTSFGTPIQDITIEISNDTVYWTTLGTTSDSTPLTFTLATGTKKYMRAVTCTWGCNQGGDPDNGNGNVITGMDKVGGNILSLIYGEDFENKDCAEAFAFQSLFFGSTTLTDASELELAVTQGNASNGNNGQYNNMFACSNIVYGPKKLFITGQLGMNSMFYNCSHLVSAPAIYCADIPMYSMQMIFQGCSSLAQVECYASSGLSDDSNIHDFLTGAAANGTLYVRKGTTTDWDYLFTRNWIPSTWTVVER